MVQSLRLPVCALELRTVEPEKPLIAARLAIICMNRGHAFVSAHGAIKTRARLCAESCEPERSSEPDNRAVQCALTHVDNQ